MFIPLVRSRETTNLRCENRVMVAALVLLSVMTYRRSEHHAGLGGNVDDGKMHGNNM